MTNTPMLTTALFIIAETAEEPKCAPMGKCKQNVVYVCIQAYVYISVCVCTHIYLYTGILFSLKKNEILLFVTTWVGLEDTMLREISHMEKDKY